MTKGVVDGEGDRPSGNCWWVYKWSHFCRGQLARSVKITRAHALRPSSSPLGTYLTDGLVQCLLRALLKPACAGKRLETTSASTLAGGWESPPQNVRHKGDCQLGRTGANQRQAPRGHLVTHDNHAKHLSHEMPGKTHVQLRSSYGLWKGTQGRRSGVGLLLACPEFCPNACLFLVQ